MTRGVPGAFHQRGRHKLTPPPDRNAGVYRDLAVQVQEPAKAAPVAKTEPEPEKKPKPEKDPKRAHEADGKFQADDPATEDVNEAYTPDAQPEPEPEVSMANKKSELLAVAEAMGLPVDEAMTKRQILDAIESA